MNPAPPTCDFTHRHILCSDITLHVASCGAGRPVVFLHGFPEYWRAFAPLMERLSDRFHCIAPDQRGFGLSDRPIEVSAYKIDILAGDIANLIDALGYEEVDIVAHDWGGLVAWQLAAQFPHKIGSMVIFNAPHPFCLQSALDHDPAQRAASTYAAQFSQAHSEEALLAQPPADLWAAFFAKDYAHGWLSDADRHAQLEMWAQPQAWTTMLNWYRAADFDYSGALDRPRNPPAPILTPILLVWGGADTLFTPSTLVGLTDIAPKCDVKVFPSYGHCVFREDLEASVTLIGEFLNPGHAKGFEKLDLG